MIMTERKKPIDLGGGKRAEKKPDSTVEMSYTSRFLLDFCSAFSKYIPTQNLISSMEGARILK